MGNKRSGLKDIVHIINRHYVDYSLMMFLVTHFLKNDFLQIKIVITSVFGI